MPKYGYWLIEKTTVYHEVEADEKVFADEMVDSYINSGEVDWGMGDMETTYEFDGEIVDSFCEKWVEVKNA